MILPFITGKLLPWTGVKVVEEISRTGDEDYDGPDPPCLYCASTRGFAEEVMSDCECGGHTQHRCLECGRVHEMYPFGL